MTDTLNSTTIRELAGAHEAPCLSLYQPTHRSRPQNQQDPIRFRNLVKELEKSLPATLSHAEMTQLLQPLHDMANDDEFWNQSLSGLAVFRARDFLRVCRLDRTVEAQAIVADSFHLKPVRRFLQSTDRYQVLQLSRGSFRLFEGDRDGLHEIELAADIPRTLTDALGSELTEGHSTVASYGGTGASTGAMHHGHGGRKSEIDIDAERFFRVVDRAVHEHYSEVTKLPLVLAALAEHHHLFHEISHNPFLLEHGVHANTDAFTLDQLRAKVWEVVQPQQRAQQAALVDSFSSAQARGLGSSNLAEVAMASVQGRVATLLIDAERMIPGKLNAVTGVIQHADLAEPDVDDLLDDLGELVQKLGGTVRMMSTELMPGDVSIAATYRH